MSSQLESIYSDELILLAETLGEVKTRTEKLEGEFSTHAKPLEAATNALSAALSGIKALQFHVLDNNLGALSARVEEMRKAVDEQVGVIALELKKADETNAAKAGQDAEALRSEIAALQAQLGTLGAQFSAQLERVEFSAKEEAKKLQLIPGPAGAAGASLNPRGTFIDGETYNRLDVVSWLGSSYISAVDGVTEKPSKNSNQWQVLASRGSGGSGGAGDFGSLAGVAQINQGGTGQTTRAAALNALLPDQAGSTQYMLLTDGSGTVSWGAQPVAGLPSQTSNSGRLLTTNGTTASWSNAVTVSGSNATVGGNLSMGGQLTMSGIYSAFTNGALVFTGNNFPAGTYDGIWLASTNDLGFVVNGATVSRISATRMSLTQTTASTSTSSGALVVSGGVGVAGNTNIGGVASVGGSSSAAVGVYVINTALTGTDQYGVASEPIWTSAANLGHTLWARTKTAASAFTLTAGHGVFVEIPTLGAGSAITNNYGVRINNQGTTGVTNAYGLYVASQSGASTLNYAIYTAGGRINFQGLPTSSAGLPAGTLWNDSGTLKVA